MSFSGVARRRRLAQQVVVYVRRPVRLPPLAAGSKHFGGAAPSKDERLADCVCVRVQVVVRACEHATECRRFECVLCACECCERERESECMSMAACLVAWL